MIQLSNPEKNCLFTRKIHDRYFHHAHIFQTFGLGAVRRQHFRRHHSVVRILSVSRHGTARVEKVAPTFFVCWRGAARRAVYLFILKKRVWIEHKILVVDCLEISAPRLFHPHTAKICLFWYNSNNTSPHVYNNKKHLVRNIRILQPTDWLFSVYTAPSFIEIPHPAVQCLRTILTWGEKDARRQY